MGRKRYQILLIHNLRHAVEYGNRLLMIHQGRVILDKNDRNCRIFNKVIEFLVEVY